MTALPEICERLRSMYAEKYGRDKVELIKDSAKVSGWVGAGGTGWSSSRLVGGYRRDRVELTKN